jgi:RND family efflux transporter MFP subunit
MKIKQLLALVVSAVMALPSTAVETTKVMTSKMDTKVIINGYVEAISESTVSSQVNAKVKKIHVDVDDRVAAGKVLIELDDTELKAQLAKAKAALEVAQAQAEQANSEYKRLMALKSESFVSENDMTRAKSAVDVAKANISLAKAQISEVTQLLTYTVIIAPYSGVVTQRHIEVGETANFGQPLLTGFALNQNRLIVHVPNSLITNVEQTKALLVKNNNQQWQQLSNLTIAPTADPMTHTVMVRANIGKDQFAQRPGSFIEVAIPNDSRIALTVPSSAVFFQGDLAAVYVKVGENFVLRQVVVGEKSNGQYEIIAGLSESDVVVKNGANYLASIK